MLVCGVNGALTRADENEVGEQQLTPRAPLDGSRANLDDKLLHGDVGHEFGRRKPHILTHIL